MTTTNNRFVELACWFREQPVSSRSVEEVSAFCTALGEFSSSGSVSGILGCPLFYYVFDTFVRELPRKPQALVESDLQFAAFLLESFETWTEYLHLVDTFLLLHLLSILCVSFEDVTIGGEVDNRIHKILRCISALNRLRGAQLHCLSEGAVDVKPKIIPLTKKMINRTNAILEDRASSNTEKRVSVDICSQVLSLLRQELNLTAGSVSHIITSFDLFASVVKFSSLSETFHLNEAPQQLLQMIFRTDGPTPPLRLYSLSVWEQLRLPLAERDCGAFVVNAKTGCKSPIMESFFALIGLSRHQEYTCVVHHFIRLLPDLFEAFLLEHARKLGSSGSNRSTRNLSDFEGFSDRFVVFTLFLVVVDAAEEKNNDLYSSCLHARVHLWERCMHHKLCNVRTDPKGHQKLKIAEFCDQLVEQLKLGTVDSQIRSPWDGLVVVLELDYLLIEEKLDELLAPSLHTKGGSQAFLVAVLNALAKLHSFSLFVDVLARSIDRNSSSDFSPMLLSGSVLTALSAITRNSSSLYRKTIWKDLLRLLKHSHERVDQSSISQNNLAGVSMFLSHFVAAVEPQNHELETWTDLVEETRDLTRRSELDFGLIPLLQLCSLCLSMSLIDLNRRIRSFSYCQDGTERLSKRDRTELKALVELGSGTLPVQVVVKANVQFAAAQAAVLLLSDLHSHSNKGAKVIKLVSALTAMVEQNPPSLDLVVVGFALQHFALITSAMVRIAMESQVDPISSRVSSALASLRRAILRAVFGSADMGDSAVSKTRRIEKSEGGASFILQEWAIRLEQYAHFLASEKEGQIVSILKSIEKEIVLVDSQFSRSFLYQVHEDIRRRFCGVVRKLLDELGALEQTSTVSTVVERLLPFLELFGFQRNVDAPSEHLPDTAVLADQPLDCSVPVEEDGITSSTERQLKELHRIVKQHIVLELCDMTSKVPKSTRKALEYTHMTYEESKPTINIDAHMQAWVVMDRNNTYSTKEKERQCASVLSAVTTEGISAVETLRHLGMSSSISDLLETLCGILSMAAIVAQIVSLRRVLTPVLVARVLKDPATKSETSHKSSFNHIGEMCIQVVLVIMEGMDCCRTQMARLWQEFLENGKKMHHAEIQSRVKEIVSLQAVSSFLGGRLIEIFRELTFYFRLGVRQRRVQQSLGSLFYRRICSVLLDTSTFLSTCTEESHSRAVEVLHLVGMSSDLTTELAALFSVFTSAAFHGGKQTLSLLFHLTHKGANDSEQVDYELQGLWKNQLHHICCALRTLLQLLPYLATPAIARSHMDDLTRLVSYMLVDGRCLDTRKAFAVIAFVDAVEASKKVSHLEALPQGIGQSLAEKLLFHSCAEISAANYSWVPLAMTDMSGARTTWAAVAAQFTRQLLSRLHKAVAAEADGLQQVFAALSPDMRPLYQAIHDEMLKMAEKRRAELCR